jgi:hypothetical protein
MAKYRGNVVVEPYTDAYVRGLFGKACHDTESERQYLRRVFGSR